MTRTQPAASAKRTAEAKPARSFADGDLILIAGLGNPGASYAGHRHNVGFMTLDRIARDKDFPGWRSRFQGEVAEGRIGAKRVVLLKPMTYMNESGRSVAEAARFYKIPAKDIIVIHDELDLAPGRCRVKIGGGHAGHNGLRSIHAHLGPDHARVRIGIGHPGHKSAVTGHVLRDFSKIELELIEPVLDGIVDGVEKLVAGDDAGFLNAVALRTKPPSNADRKSAAAGKKSPHQARAASRSAGDARRKADEALADKPKNPLAQLLARFSR
ncbi:MAG TPA: aminoacyl-tRNA hydrolase [Paracoccaceae bacterium]|nr:aminoacyl-tRNA hydrolase [Paracoccaceae bacterium]